MSYQDSQKDKQRRLSTTRSSEIEYLSEDEIRSLMETVEKVEREFENGGRQAARALRERMKKEGLL